MKTLSKLKINQEKVLDSNELRSLKGGWYGTCDVQNGSYQTIFSGGGYGADQWSTIQACNSMWNSAGLHCDCH